VTPSDKEIVILCQKGDSEKFGLLYCRYVEKIYNFFYFRTFQRETAEDLTSRTFLKAFSCLKTYDPDKGNFSTWIYRIAQNGLIDFFRVNKNHACLEDVISIAKHDDDLENVLENKESLAKVRQCLDKFPEESKNLVIMRLWDGLSYKEISEMLGKSESSCKMKFSRVIARIRVEALSIIVSFLLFN
jgi:RNA polymerase sigma-70 factor, ECF subfamily